MKTEVDRTRSATPGMQAFSRLETVADTPLTTTVGLFITDETWEELGRPLRLSVTLERVTP